MTINDDRLKELILTLEEFSKDKEFSAKEDVEVIAALRELQQLRSESKWVKVGDGVSLIAAERQRQIAVEGWTPEHDDEHNGNQIAMAAACYATGLETKVKITVHDCNCRSAGECMHVWGTDKWVNAWPWDKEWDKREKHDRLKQLAIAGALIAAEIDRLKRLPSSPKEGSDAQVRRD